MKMRRIDPHAIAAYSGFEDTNISMTWKKGFSRVDMRSILASILSSSVRSPALDSAKSCIARSMLAPVGCGTNMHRCSSDNDA